MSKPKHGGRGGGRINPSAEILAALKADSEYPPAVKQEIRLAISGGRQRPRRCLGCGAVPAPHIKLYVTYRAMSVAGDPDRKACTMYWTCEHCHAAGLTPELEARLLEILT
jgi:hypothetical protein